MHPLLMLLERHPLVFAHMLMAVGALLLGLRMLRARKGDARHRRLGWVWVALMGGTAASSAFILDSGLPNIGGFTPIHAFTVLVLAQLPRAVGHARAGRVQAHRQAMRGLYFGGCLAAGAFALLPGRFLGRLLWTHALALAG
jgi:uncharacterized membrane protein